MDELLVVDVVDLFVVDDVVVEVDGELVDWGEGGGVVKRLI